MDQNENLIDLLSILYKWRKKIIIYTLIAGIGTTIVCLFLPNFYKATTIFYAASPDLAKPLSVGLSEKDINFYGQDTDLDRLFSIARSNELSDFLIKKFNLYEHYDIDSTSKTGPFNLRVKLSKLYKTQKNKYDALELSVEDTDPKFAAEMANAARIKINEIGQSLIKNSQQNLLDGYEKNIEDKTNLLNTVTNELVELRDKYNIYSISAQGEAYASSITKTEGKLSAYTSKLNAVKSSNGPRDSIILLDANVKGLKSQLNDLKEDVKLFNEGYSVVLNKELQQKEMVDQLSLDIERTKQLKSALNSEFSSLHVVQNAEVPIYKSRPKRSIIILAASFLAGLLCCLWVLLLHQYSSLNWKSIIEEK